MSGILTAAMARDHQRNVKRLKGRHGSRELWLAWLFTLFGLLGGMMWQGQYLAEKTAAKDQAMAAIQQQIEDDHGKTLEGYWAEAEANNRAIAECNP